MTKANMMREAHKLAKTFEGDYTACLALALRILNKGVVEMTEIEIVEKFLNENREIAYGTKGRVFIMTDEFIKEFVLALKEEKKFSLEKYNCKKRAMNEIRNRIDDILPSAFSKMK